jgi:uncharacterized protein (DUF1015 family)
VTNLPSFDLDGFGSKAAEYFRVSAVPDMETLESRLNAADPARPTIGLVAGTGNVFMALELRQDLDLGRLLPDVSPAQAGLDVVVLHRLVIEKCLGISEEEVRGENYLRYVRGGGAAVDEVRRGSAELCFLLNATRLEQVRDIAFRGEVLPQKSTDFFPKLLSGLAMYAMD